MKSQKGYVLEDCEAIYGNGSSYDDRCLKGCRQKTITSGNIRECEIYPIFNRKDYSRAKKTLETSEKQIKQNAKNTRKKIVRLLNANFTEKDIWVTLTYDDSHLPKTLKDAHRDLQNYIRRIAYLMKKQEREFKYLYVTEYIDKEKTVRVHHHVVMNFNDRDKAEKAWGEYGRTQARRLQPDESGLEGMGIYLAKFRSVKYAKTWAYSRNLKMPKVTVSDTAISRRRARKMVMDHAVAFDYFEKINPGYRVLEIYTAISDVIAGAYIYAKMRKRD